MTPLKAALAALLAAAALLPTALLAADKEKPSPSGLPVPRYISLKSNDVNARYAPEGDAPVRWVYHTKGLPVQVLAETPDWRRICDPEHGVAWIHRSNTDGRRMVMRLKPQPLALHDGPKADSGVRAYLASRALAELDRCNKDEWCKLKAGHVSGWVPAGEVWGTADKPQC